MTLFPNNHISPKHGRFEHLFLVSNIDGSARTLIVYSDTKGRLTDHCAKDMRSRISREEFCPLLTLPMLKLSRTQRFLKNHLNPVWLVFIGILSLSISVGVHYFICLGFSYFSGFLPIFVLAKLTTSIMRVNWKIKNKWS